jgi:putative hemolysin
MRVDAIRRPQVSRGSDARIGLRPSIVAAGMTGTAEGARLFPRTLVRRFGPRLAENGGGGLARMVTAKVLSWPQAWRAPSLGRLGSLEVRLAASAFEVRRAQALRYHVFYEEMAAEADFRARQTRRDQDRFDRFCDHLIVLDHAARGDARFGATGRMVATYRLLRHDVAARHCGFYSAGEFDIEPLLARKPDLNFLELGRSCVLPPYRTKRAVELLWHGIWAYVRAHGIDVMIGCASLPGTDPAELALPLSFLHHHARAPAEWDVRARGDRHVEMARMPAAAIDARAALKALPPLVKGYLRLGAMIGDGAVIDRQFGTTDVMMVLPVAAIAERYIEHYGTDATRFALKAPRPRGDRPLVAA